jgi:hypothetical protein
MKKTLVLFLFALAAMGVAATPPDQSTGQTSAVRIVRPTAGQVLTNSFVLLRFELVRPNPAGGGNNFVIQLDAHESVTTSDNEYTFTGIRPGKHVITVAEVDANRTPLPDSRAEVQFTVALPESTAPRAATE